MIVVCFQKIFDLFSLKCHNVEKMSKRWVLGGFRKSGGSEWVMSEWGVGQWSPLSGKWLSIIMCSQKVFGLYDPIPYTMEKNCVSWKKNTQGGNSTTWGNVSPPVAMKQVG